MRSSTVITETSEVTTYVVGSVITVVDKTVGCKPWAYQIFASTEMDHGYWDEDYLVFQGSREGHEGEWWDLSGNTFLHPDAQYGEAV